MRLRLLFCLAALGSLLVGCSKPEPINENHPGALEASDSTHPDDGSYFDDYEFKAAEGMTITVAMTSTDVDSYIQLLDSDGNLVSQNDDITPGNLNAQVVVPAPTTGNYTARANSRNVGETGAYVLTIVTAGGAS